MPQVKSWLAVTPDHVMLTSLKRAEDQTGWIVRLYEIGESDCLARLALPTGQWSAVMTDPTERNQRSLPIVDKTAIPSVQVAMRKGQIATLRLEKIDTKR